MLAEQHIFGRIQRYIEIVLGGAVGVLIIKVIVIILAVGRFFCVNFCDGAAPLFAFYVAGMDNDVGVGSKASDVVFVNGSFDTERAVHQDRHIRAGSVRAAGVDLLDDAADRSGHDRILQALLHRVDLALLELELQFVLAVGVLFVLNVGGELELFGFCFRLTALSLIEGDLIVVFRDIVLDPLQLDLSGSDLAFQFSGVIGEKLVALLDGIPDLDINLIDRAIGVFVDIRCLLRLYYAAVEIADVIGD